MTILHFINAQTQKHTMEFRTKKEILVGSSLTTKFAHRIPYSIKLVDMLDALWRQQIENKGKASYSVQLISVK